MTSKIVLAGDIGGTKTQLALFDWSAGSERVVKEGRYTPPPPLAFDTYSSKAPGGLGGLIRQFLDKSQARPEVACFGVAGPVLNEHVKAPNIPWEVDAAELRAEFGLRSVHLMNDLEACAYGVLCLEGSQVRTLQAGSPRAGGAVAVIAAGTGLGEAALVSTAGRYAALPSEGGHADFAPIDDETVELWRFVNKTDAHVSYERILAGPGVARIYGFLRSRSAAAAPSDLDKALASAPDPSAVISARALDGSDAMAVKALQLFAKVYGAEAGNLALRTLPYGGLYVAGGIAPKILPFLTNGEFLTAFSSKGRMARLVPQFPVHVVLEPRAPLLGAALVGAVG